MSCRGVHISDWKRQRIVRLWESGRGVMEICRILGVSKPTTYKWLQRWEAEGAEGLRTRPYPPRQREPRQTPVQVEQFVCQLAASHPEWGWRRLASSATPMRYPDGGMALSTQTVRSILARDSS